MPNDIVIKPRISDLANNPIIEFTGSLGGIAQMEVTPTGGLHISSSAFTLTTEALYLTGTFSQGDDSAAIGLFSHAEGMWNEAQGDYSHAEGKLSIAAGNSSHAEGSGSLASGLSAHAEGHLTSAPANYSHAEGWATISSGSWSHAEGKSSVTTGSWSHSEGIYTIARGDGSHAEGSGSLATGTCSHAEGKDSTALGDYSHAAGLATLASGYASFAMGSGSVAAGNFSFAMGEYVIASGSTQTVFGRFNSLDNSDSLFVIGNGSSNEVRDDIFIVNSGSVSIGSASLSQDTFFYVGKSASKNKAVFEGSIQAVGGVSGSLQNLVSGESFLKAGTGITISTSSLSPVGQITIESTGEGKFGNTIIVLKTTGGKYTSLQNAIDSASSGDTILVGAGSWGDIDLSQKPGISITGLQPPLADEVVISKLTFSPTTGTAATNTIFISNLRISNNSQYDSALLLGQTANITPIRVTMSGVRVYRNNASAISSMVLCYSHASDTDTSIYMKNCYFTHESGQNSSALMSNGARYLDLENCQFSNGAFCLATYAGTIACSFVRFETASTGDCIETQPGVQLLIGNSLVRNLGINSNGIRLYAGAVCVISDTVFDISTGSGAVIAGNGGTLVKNNLTVQPAALGSRNTTISPSVTQLSFQTL